MPTRVRSKPKKPDDDNIWWELNQQSYHQDVDDKRKVSGIFLGGHQTIPVANS